MTETLTRMTNTLPRMTETLTRMPNTFTRMSNTLARMTNTLTRMTNTLTRMTHFSSKITQKHYFSHKTPFRAVCISAVGCCGVAVLPYVSSRLFQREGGYLSRSIAGGGCVAGLAILPFVSSRLFHRISVKLVERPCEFWR